MEANRAWLERWRGAIDAVVRDRVELYESVKCPGNAGPPEAEIRAFVETCLLKLGRLPSDEEDAARWEGQDLAIAGLTPRKRAKLGLDVNHRIGRYRVRATYLSAIETHGWDFDQGAGWYLVVLNPSIEWRFNDPAGPYLSPEDAIRRRVLSRRAGVTMKAGPFDRADVSNGRTRGRGPCPSGAYPVLERRGAR